MKIRESMIRTSVLEVMDTATAYFTHIIKDELRAQQANDARDLVVELIQAANAYRGALYADPDYSPRFGGRVARMEERLEAALDAVWADKNEAHAARLEEMEE